MEQGMNFKARAWLKKGLIAGIGGTALAVALIGASTASADDGKYCVVKNPDGDCIVYGTRPVIWGGAGVNSFVSAPQQPITIDPSYYDYLLSPRYYPYYFYGVGYYPYNNYPFYNGYYSNTVLTSSNLPAPVYVVVAATADALNADRGYIYSLLVNGESLDQITDRFGVPNSIFLTNFYNQLDVRINETLANGTLQQWQAVALRTNSRNSWWITQQYLLNTLAQYQ
jgi:hypothetical protein